MTYIEKFEATIKAVSNMEPCNEKQEFMYILELLKNDCQTLDFGKEDNR